MQNIFTTNVSRDTSAMVAWLHNYQREFGLTDAHMANLIGLTRQRWQEIRRGQGSEPGAKFREHARLRFGPNFWQAPLPSAPITDANGYPGNGWGVSAPSGQDCGGNPGPTVSQPVGDPSPANTAGDDSE